MQVRKLEQTLTQAQLTIAQQAQDMDVLGRAQALADWTSFATTRKRYLSSVVSHLVRPVCQTPGWTICTSPLCLS